MIPLGAPQIDDEGVQAVVAALESGTLSVGDRVAAFEDRFCELVGREHGVAVASGSVALELALEACFDGGDRVAISPYNCGSVLYSILRVDLDPVFVDADPETAAISPAALRRREDIDGVVLAHLFGHPADVDGVVAAADDLNATIVEDFAQAPGATYDGRPVGAVGRVSVCSFGATKNVTTAEGGIVVTDDRAIAGYASAQRSNTDDVTPPPRSVRMNDIEAEIGLHQLDRYGDALERKRAVAAIYRDRLDGVEMPDVAEWATHVYHAFPVLHESAHDLAAHLGANGVGTSRLYNTLLSEYDAAPSVDDEFPVARRFANETVLLPIHAGVSHALAETVAQTVDAFATEPTS